MNSVRNNIDEKNQFQVPAQLRQSFKLRNRAGHFVPLLNYELRYFPNEKRIRYSLLLWGKVSQHFSKNVYVSLNLTLPQDSRKQGEEAAVEDPGIVAAVTKTTLGGPSPCHLVATNRTPAPCFAETSNLQTFHRSVHSRQKSRPNF